MSKFSEYFTIRGYDINAAYQITPAALCGYFQESFARYCTMKNVAAFDIIPNNLLWVVSDIHIEFKNQMNIDFLTKKSYIGVNTKRI